MEGAFRGRKTVALAITSATFVALGGVGVAQSGKSKGRIFAESVKQSRQEARGFARSFAGPKLAPSAVFAIRPPYGRVAARASKRLAGFPLDGDWFTILSTGNAFFADDPDKSGAEGAFAGGPEVRGARDVTIFRVNLRVPRNRNCLSFRFKYLTEEFPEFIGEEFNDGFVAELDRTTWDTGRVGDPSIQAPDNFAADSEGNRISVNATGDATLAAKNAKGTTYDGATRRLRASTRITPGRHRLFLSIFDQGDRQYDSAVFIDDLTVSKKETCESGAVEG
jgi:hypothetical protein